MNVMLFVFSRKESDLKISLKCRRASNFHWITVDLTTQCAAQPSYYLLKVKI